MICKDDSRRFKVIKAGDGADKRHLGQIGSLVPVPDPQVIKRRLVVLEFPPGGHRSPYFLEELEPVRSRGVL